MKNPLAWIVALFAGLLIFIVEEMVVGTFAHAVLNAITAIGGPYSALMVVAILALLTVSGVAGLLKLFGKL